MPVEEIERSDHTVTVEYRRGDGSRKDRRVKTVKCPICDKPPEEWPHEKFSWHLLNDHSPEDI